MKKYLFLDIDGVLNSHEYFRRQYTRQEAEPTSFVRADIDPDAVAHLRRIVAETGTLIVLSSTWRRGGKVRYEPLLASNGYPIEELPIVGDTPDIESGHPDLPHRFRGLEIEAYLRGVAGLRAIAWNPEKLRRDCERREFFNYVILDDDSDMLYDQRHNVLCIPGELGLTEETTNEAIRILNTPYWEMPYHHDWKKYRPWKGDNLE